MKTHPKPKNSSESLPAKGEPFSSCAPFAVSKRTPQREKLAHIRGEGKGKSKERGKANHCACGLPLLFPLRSLERFPGLKVGANNFGGGGGSLRETSSATFFEGMSFFRCVCVCVCVCWLVGCVCFFLPPPSVELCACASSKLSLGAKALFSLALPRELGSFRFNGALLASSLLFAIYERSETAQITMTRRRIC